MNQRKYLVTTVIVLICITFVYIIYSRKHEAKLPSDLRQIKLAQKMIRRAGIILYPKSKAIDAQVTQINAGNYAYLWLTTNADLEKVRSFYKQRHKYVLSQQKDGDEFLLLQLSSVRNIAEAITKKKKMISLVDIRRNKFTPEDRSAFEKESAALEAVEKPTDAQRKRTKELEKLLTDNTLIKITLRLSR